MSIIRRLTNFWFEGLCRYGAAICAAEVHEIEVVENGKKAGQGLPLVEHRINEWPLLVQWPPENDDLDGR